MTKEEFNSVWKDTSREDILNQFYYEHMEIQQLKNNWNELKEYIDKNKLVLNNPQILDFYLKMQEIESGKNE